MQYLQAFPALGDLGIGLFPKPGYWSWRVVAEQIGWIEEQGLGEPAHAGETGCLAIFAEVEQFHGHLSCQGLPLESLSRLGLGDQ